jgi:predicted transcriptional regulator
VIRETIDDLLDRLFAGEALPLMKHLVEERGLSDDDIAQLRSMLDRLEKDSSE